MKKALISILFLVASLGANAQAWFNIQANCVFNNSVAKCSVYNRWYQPITCRIQAVGQTFYGAQAVGSKTVIVPAGFTDGMSVFALNPLRDPLVVANASAVCRF